MPFEPKYAINYLPNNAGDSTARAISQLINERNYMYTVINFLTAGRVGTVKTPCRIVATANITLSGLQTIDGVTVITNDRVLVAGQTLPAQNGIYLAGPSTWTRALDLDEAADFVDGAVALISEGTDGANKIYFLISDTTVEVGTSEILFSTVLDKGEKGDPGEQGLPGVGIIGPPGPAGSTLLTGLLDTDIATPTNLQYLGFDKATETWKNMSFPISREPTYSGRTGIPDIDFSGAIDVTLSTTGNGINNNTVAFANAFATCAGITGHTPILYVPKPTVKYIVNKLDVPSNIKIIFEAGTIIEGSSSYAWGLEGPFNINGKDNISIQGNGVIIQMPTFPVGHTPEYPETFYIMNSTDLYFDNVYCKDPWGDGFRVENVSRMFVENSKVTGFHRNGLSIIGVDDTMIVYNSIFSDCASPSTANPGCGIDIEPNTVDNKLENVHIRNCTFENNTGGISITLYQFYNTAASYNIEVTIEQPVTKNNYFYGIGATCMVLNPGTLTGFIKIYNPTSDGDGIGNDVTYSYPFHAGTDNNTNSHNCYLYLENPVITNPNAQQVTWASEHTENNWAYLNYRATVTPEILDVKTGIVTAKDPTYSLDALYNVLFDTTPASGDLFYHDGTTWTRLPKGTDGQTLKMVNGLPAWIDVPSGSEASSFSALSDFSIDRLTDGDSPQYDAARGLWVNKPADGSECVATPHKSWRILGVAGGGLWFRVQELQFRTALGVPEVPSGGTAIASSEYPGQGASNAFDGDTGTQWACAAYGTAGQWIGYTFAEAKAVEEVAICQSTGLTDFDLEYADEDGVWHVYTSYTSLGAWENVLTAFRATDPAQAAKYIKALIDNPTAGQIIKRDGENWVNADAYTHPTGDGNLHVPSTGTSSNGKVLTAGATAGSMSWETPGSSASTTLIYGHKIDIPPAIPDALDDEFDGTSLVGKWTIISQYTNTVYLKDSHLVIDTPLSAQTKGLGVLQTAPSSNWKVRAKVSIDSLVWNYYGVGLMARYTATDKRIWAGIMAHSGYGCMSGIVQRLNAETLSSETDLCNFVNHECYFEMEYDGSNIIWRISVSGVAFRTFYTEAVSSFLGSPPDQIGICCNPWDETGAGWGGLSSWDWFRRIS